MRTVRLSLVGVVTLVLLAGVASIALAQEPEEVTWTHVTGQNLEDWVELETAGASRWDGSVEYQDVWEYIMPIEWSDPRLPAAMHIREQAVVHHGDVESPDDAMWLFSRAVRLDAPDGAWVGSARGVAGADGTTLLQYELTGEGAYEGLSAVFGQDNSEWPNPRFDGWIFESEQPPMPGLPEPYTAE